MKFVSSQHAGGFKRQSRTVSNVLNDVRDESRIMCRKSNHFHNCRCINHHVRPNNAPMTCNTICKTRSGSLTTSRIIRLSTKTRIPRCCSFNEVFDDFSTTCDADIAFLLIRFDSNFAVDFVVVIVVFVAFFEDLLRIS